MAIQSSGPLESAGIPVTKAGRASLGQNKTSSARHGLWQRTRGAFSGGMSAVCSSRARLVAWGAAAGKETNSEAVAGFAESGSPGRAVAGVVVGEVFCDGRGWCSNLRQRHFPSLLLRVRRISGSHGGWANSRQRHFHSLLR